MYEHRVCALTSKPPFAPATALADCLSAFIHSSIGTRRRELNAIRIETKNTMGGEDDG